MGLIRKLMLLLVFFTAASLLLADDELKVSCTIGLSGSKASVRFTDNDTNGNPIDRSTVHLDVDTENTFKASIMDGENLFLDYDIESAGNVDITLTLTGPFQRIVGDDYLDWKLTSERKTALGCCSRTARSNSPLAISGWIMEATAPMRDTA